MSGITALRLVSADADALAAFYVTAFGARIVSRNHAEESTCLDLRVGLQQLEIVSEASPHPAPPVTAPSTDLAFQHFAMVAPDMDAAMERLSFVSGWSAISRDGPETLPKSSGGVTAFKFRDPDGHPLEFLTFPEDGVPSRWQGQTDTIIGIDHTAISVSDTATSVAFYDTLGFRPVHRSLNRGPQQARLDDVDGADLEVTRLEIPASAPPALELLCYRGAMRRPRRARSTPPLAATRIVLEGRQGVGAEPKTLHDPDDHRLTFR